MAKRSYRCTIVGHFAEQAYFTDGQTVKTKNLHRALVEHMGIEHIDTVDTYGFKKHIVSFFAKCFSAIKNSENIIVLPAHNGVRVLLPFFALLNLLFHRKLHYAVIGGWLPEFLDQHKWLKAFAKRFDGIYVETTAMKKGLEQRGLTNAVVMPNFKFITPLTGDELIYPSGEPYKLCTFSRVMKEKGIADAVDAVRQVNETLGRTVYTLDIYGQVDENQTTWFDQLQKQFPEYVRYCGVIPPEESVQTLKEYFALLFPTEYEGEGLAGTLIDALASGVPIIATDWRYNAETVNEQNGFLIPVERKVEQLSKLLLEIAEEPDAVLRRKKQCLNDAKKYTPSSVINIFAQKLH